MKREYTSPAVEEMELELQPLCQSVQQYKIGGDSYDSDSD